MIMLKKGMMISMEKYNEVSLEEVLESREERVELQRRLISTYKAPLVSFMVNMPGPVKLCPMTLGLHREGMKAILETLESQGKRVLLHQVFEKKTGIEGYIAVDCNAMELKKTACSIEDTHELGRLFDIDVLDMEGVPIKREQLSLAPRRCLLCNEVSSVCSRSRRHSIDELIAKMENMVEGYKSRYKD